MAGPGKPEKKICIHGHFYQPPRENPWTGEVEEQPGAAPYHDWNARIAAECYGPNAAARILDSAGEIREIVNNYSRISFNFGPTLLSWLEQEESRIYAAILQADRESRTRYSGHGAALAQSYHHSILPLANRRDKETEVRWGLRDFEWRFGRKPEGMWLPETAVDLETLDVLERHGMLFTILSPFQAASLRSAGAEDWTPVAGPVIDTRRAYRVELPSRRSIAVFFYDGAISQEVAFGNLLNNGEEFGFRLLNASAKGDPTPLISIATDGETYGHHHRFGEMALAYALDTIEKDAGGSLSIFGEFLERFPPRHLARIREKTAWSCSHRLGRWTRDCGCHTGGEPGWNQNWRAPLRESLDWLRDTLASKYEEEASRFFRDPWEARNGYIDLLLDRGRETRQDFFDRSSPRRLSAEEEREALRLLELQRFTLMMYTSCGWFFNDLAGIETIQILRYADRALEMAGEIFGEDLSEPFLRRLERAKSNLPEEGTGRDVYTRRVFSARSLSLPSSPSPGRI